MKALEIVRDSLVLARGAVALSAIKAQGQPTARNLLGGAGDIVGNYEDLDGQWVTRDRLRLLYSLSSWVRSAADMKADLMLHEGKIFRRRADGEKEPIPDHPFMQVWDNPNPVMTTADLQIARSIDQDLTGHAYWYIVPGSLLEPLQIWRLDPLKTRPVLGDDGVAYYRFEGERGTFNLPAPLVCHFRNYSPYHPLDAVPTLRSIFEPSLGDVFAGRYQRRFEQEAIRPKVAFSTNEEMDPEEARELSRDLSAGYGGPQNAGRPMVLWGGLTPVKLAFTPQEADLVASRGVTRDEVLAGFRMSKTALGIMEDANRASAETVEYALAKRLAQPALTRVAQRVSATIRILYRDPEITFEFPNVVPVDQDRLIKKVTIAAATQSVTKDEVRSQLLPDLGELDGHDGGELAKPGKGGGAGPGGDRAGTAVEGPEQAGSERAGEPSTRGWALKQADEELEEVVDALEGPRAELIDAVNEYFLDQRDELVDYIESS